MSHFERGSERHPIPPGESALAMDAGGPSVVPGPGGPGRRAILKTAPDGEVVIVKVQDADLTINGVRLGSEPTPLLHGDKVGAGGVELTFVDERRSGSTVFMAALEPPVARTAGPASPGGAAAATGGRLVCLTDGREYSVGGSSVIFGREAGCDIVVSGKDVSRRHAEILPTAKGYVLIDHSTNGTFVNDERIPGQRLLARGDVIRIGTDEFRFYADQGSSRDSAPRHAALQATMHGIPVGDLQPPAAPVMVAVPPSATPEPAAAAPGAGAAEAFGPVASFLLRDGPRKGTRLPVRSFVANVGRAEYNDVMLDDRSVSAQHAKLQRREGIWILVDLESTNGTFVDGERVVGESPLAPGSMVRFGDVQLIFEPLDDALGMGSGAPKTSLLARESVEALEEQVRGSASSPASPPADAAEAALAAPSRSPRSPAAEPRSGKPASAMGDAKRRPSVAPRAGAVGRAGLAAREPAAPARPSVQRAERATGLMVAIMVVVAVAVTALIFLLT